MNKKIKIIHILTELGFGGAERLLLDLIRSLDRDKFEVKVCCVISGGAFKEELEKLSIKVQVIGKKTKLGLGAIWKIYKYIKQEKPDIVHTHLFAGDFWGKIGAFLARVPIIVSTEHNVNIEEGKIKQIIKKITYRFTKKVVAVSGAVKNYTERVYKVKPEKIEVIYNGIDLERFKYKIPNLKKEKIIIGNVGRLEEQKGHRYLIEAFKKIKIEYPQTELWIVGEGSLREELERQIEGLGLKESVKLLGQRKDIPELFAQFDVFVMPSLWEGLGIVVIEAMACGLPIIASNVDGLRELITDKKNGLLAEAGLAKSLSEAILRLLKNPELAVEMSKRVRKDAEEKFDFRKLTKEYEGLYRELVSSFLHS